jgi:hypothetical protein
MRTVPAGTEVDLTEFATPGFFGRHYRVHNAPTGW